MPVTIKAANLKYKTAEGEYIGVNSISDNTTAEQLAAIEGAGEEHLAAVNNAGTTQITNVQNAGQEVLDSIPEDYDELVEEVIHLKENSKILFSQAFTDAEELTKRTTESDYKILPDKKRTAASGYSIVKYEVTAGDLIHINTTELSQFQSNTGWIDGNNVIGNQISGEACVIVPEGAITLCMTKLADSTSKATKAIGVIGNTREALYTEKDEIYRTTRPDQELSWPINGYYRVATGAFTQNDTTKMSNRILVSAGELLYVYGKTASADMYLVAAFDNEDTFIPALSAVGANIVNAADATYAAYLVPSGVSYIRITSTSTWTHLGEVITKPWYNNESELKSLLYNGDERALTLKNNAGWNHGRLSYDNGVSNADLYGLLPVNDLYVIYITNTDEYGLVVYWFDDELNSVSSATRDYVFLRSAPQSAKYFRFRVRKKDGTAISDVFDSGLTILSLRCYEDQEAIHGYEKMRPGNWNKDYFTNSCCISVPAEEKMAHVSNLYDGEDGHFYTTYYANHAGYVEGIAADIVTKIAKVNQANLDVTIQEIARKGQDFGNFAQSDSSAPYDPLLIPKDANNFTYLFVAVPSDTNKACVAYANLSKETLLLGVASVCDFKYTIAGVTQTVQMDVDNLSIFIDRLLGTAEGTHTIGAYPILSRPVAYDNALYSYLGGLQTTNVDTGFAGCIVKSTDGGKTWEYVAYNTALTNVIVCMWEGAIAIDDNGRVFCELKSVFRDSEIGTGYYFCDYGMYYDIQSDSWSDAIRLNGVKNGTGFDRYLNDNWNISYYNGGLSRPFVYLSNGYVYMMHNVTPAMPTAWKPSGVTRSTLRILKFDRDLNLIDGNTLQTDAGVSYFSCVNAKGREWFCFTEDKRHMQNDCKGQISIIPMTDGFLP